VYISNPKTAGSGIICAIPQKGKCPHNCADCFFQSGRGYLEPLEDNLPNIPFFLTQNQVLRVNDGNDSNHQRTNVIESTDAFVGRRFFNTSVPKPFDEPWVLTANPGKMTNTSFHQPHEISDISQLMFVRFRINASDANLELAYQCCKKYTELDVPVVLTFMAYFNEPIPEGVEDCYEERKRTLNSYHVIRYEEWEEIMTWAREDFGRLVHSCSGPDNFKCKHCGTCLREFYRIQNQ
jgi:hypothetical protein